MKLSSKSIEYERTKRTAEHGIMNEMVYFLYDLPIE